MGPLRRPLLWGFRGVLLLLLHVSILTAGQRPPERPPRPAGWSPAPSSSWAPTLEPGAPGDAEGSAAALAFLRTGDAQRLARANCSGAVAAAATPGPGPPPALRTALRAAPEALSHAANFLNMLFQTNDIREASVAEDVEWYQALVRSLAEGHPWVRRAVLALDAHPLAPKPRLMLQATKGDGQILLQDVSGAAPSLGNLSWDNEWFNALKSQRVPALRKRVLSNDLRSLETPKWQRGDSYVGDPGHVRWSPPFLECREGRFVPTWAVTLSSAFYGLKPDLSPEFKGVVRVDVELRDVAIDQCSSGPGWFSDTHRCDLNSTQCVPQESRGFVLGRYLCRCKPGFYGAGGVASGAWAGPPGTDGGSRLGCRPCRPGCATCEDDTPCLIQEDPVLRAAVLACQACCMLAIFLSMLVSYHFRRSKRIRTSGIILLETILFGSLLLYFPVFILYFKPSIFRCIVLRWVRMLGFAIVYGTITLKLYRVLKLFLSRSAPRVPAVSSARVLRLLAPVLLLVLWFLAAWTMGMLQNARRNIPLVIRARTARGLRFSICGHDCWDYMMVIAEMLFLLWGSFLCYATRAVPSAFHEPRYMGIALHNELMVSAAFHVVRFLIVPSLHPDWTLLLFFAHTHGTITMTLALLFIPKFLHSGSPLREEITAEVYEDELDMRRSGSCMNSSIASAWSERSLDPDDIREELKKLYRQLEVHKTWRMATNNPHLPRKRSSRRSLARSILRRGGAELAEPESRRSSTGDRTGTLSHRSSAGDRTGTLSHRSSAGDRTGTLSRRSSSTKRLGDGGGSVPRVRDDNSRRRSSALRKSRSSEGPPRDPRRGSRSPSPTREPPAGTDAEPSDSDSLDAAPLVCKSASAQNLAGPWWRPPGRAPPLQKSHSVVTGAREVALLAARAATREEWRGGRHLSVPGVPEGSATTPSPARGDAAALGEAKGHKHVTYAPVKSVSVDSAHPPRRVRVTVRKTPPAPPVRYQSLQRSGTLGDGPEPPPGPPPGPPPEPPAQAGEVEGTAGDTPGKGRRLTPSASSAHVCPWELIQDEILSRKQKAAEAADSGTPGDTAATTPGPKAPPQKSFRSLGLAIKALNRSRGKSILKGKRESEGSLRKRGSSRRERPSPAEGLSPEPATPGGLSPEPATPGGLSPEPATPGGLSPEPATPGGLSPEGSGRSPEPPELQHNNNAATAGENVGWGDRGTGHGDSLAPGTARGDKAAQEPSAGWGDRGTEGHGDSLAPGTARGDKAAQEPSAGWGDIGTEGHGDSLAPGTARGDKAAQEPSAARQDADIDGGLESPSAGHQGAECRRESPGVAWEGDEAPAVKDIPAVTEEEGTLERLQGTRRPSQPRDHPEEEPRPPSGVRGAAVAKVCPPGALGTPAGRATLLRQEAIAPREDGDSPDSSDTALGQPERGPGELRAGGDSGSEPRIGTAAGKGGGEGEPRRSPGVEKPPEVPKAPPERAQGRGAEVCPWDTEMAPEGQRSPKSGGVEQGKSVRAEICPWDTERAPEGQEIPKSREDVEQGRDVRAEICPWDTDREPEGQGIPKSGGAVEQGRDVRAEICPWDTDGAPEVQGIPKSGGAVEQPGVGVAKKAPAVPKSSSQQAGMEKANICPWEVEEPRPKAEICPWEEAVAPSGKERLSQDTRGTSKGDEKVEFRAAGKGKQPPGKPQSEGSALPKAPPGKSQSSEKAEICPWETQDSKSTDKAEICPWEVAEPQLKNGRAPGKEKVPGKEATKTPEKGSTDRESICPWESLDTEQPPRKTQSGSSAGPKAAPGKSQSSEKAEICPREAQEPKSSDKAEICPWEVAEPQLEKGTAPGKEKIPPKERTKAPEKSSRDRESICPWESPDTEQPPEKPKTGSSAGPKAAPVKSQSSESLEAEICPWESHDSKSSDKVEICPWEVAEPQLEKGIAPGKEKIPGKEVTKAVEKSSTDRESICPWESPDTEQPPEKPHTGSSALPQTSGKSQSTKKAEICPWETQDSKSTDKGEICPWEVAEPQLEKGTAPGKVKIPPKERTKAPEKSSKDRESICPWESLDTEQPPGRAQIGSSELPKAPSGKSQSSESLKAEICPWESHDSKSSDKAEICPWEVAEPQLEKGTAPGKQKMLPKEGTKAVDKGSRDRESVCPWELESSGKDEICPWESAAPQLERGTAPGKEKIPPREASKASEKGSKDRESICPWESPDTEQPPGKPKTGSSAGPKAAPVKSQSSESLKAEICPWESHDAKSSDKVEICPWEVAEPQLEKGIAPGKEKNPGKEVTKAVEKSSKDRESICPWESPDTEQPPGRAQIGSSELPKAPSGKSQSSEKAEICPWEIQDSKSSDKAEICPWEVAEPPSLQPKAQQVPAGGSKDKALTRQAALGSPERALDKGSTHQESICPWELESPGKAEICPWEAQDSKSSDKGEICPWETQDSKSSDKAEICPWEMAEPQLEKGTAPGKQKMPPKEGTKAPEKSSRDRESICPWESPDTEQPPGRAQIESSELPKAPSGKSQSLEKAEICPWELKSPGKAEICPWESQEPKSSNKAEICPWDVSAPELEKGTAPGKQKIPSKEGTEAPEKGTRDRESICPWESPDTEQPPGKPKTGSSELPKAPPGKSQSSEKAEICPWETQDSKSTDKAEICPWEVAAPQLEKGTASGKEKVPGKEATKAPEKGSTDRESICPWESLDTEQPPGRAQIESSAGPKTAPGKSQSSEKAEICPWESQEPKSSGKAEICPWEVAEPQLEKGTASGKEKVPGKEATKGLEKSSTDRESICPWESPDTEQPSGKTQSGSSALPKAAPGKSQSSEKAEICPWETQDSKSTDKGEICPWEVAEPQLEKGTGQRGKEKLPSKEGTKGLEKGSKDRESICPWESPDTEEPPGKPYTGSSAGPKTPSGKSQSSEKAQICPWETQDSKSSDKSEICPWEAAEPLGPQQGLSPAGAQPQGSHRASPAGMAKPGASAASAAAQPQKTKGQARGEAEHKPLCRLLPGVRPAGMGSASPGPGLAEVCPWEAGEAPEGSPQPSVDRGKSSEVCPWEAGEAPEGSAEPSVDTGKSSEVCPWEEEGADPTWISPGGRPRDGDGV